MCSSERSGSVTRQKPEKTSMICQGMFCSIIRNAFIIFRTYFDLFIDFIFSLHWNDYRQNILDLDKNHNILAKSALTLAKDIREKRLKSVELVTACIERIRLVNPVLNAVTDQRYKAALAEAREVDQKIEAGLSDDDFKKRPFLGVPFTAKESHGVEGLLYTFGIRSRRTVRAPSDAECVRLLREAGAIPVAVTNVPEINKWQETYNMVFGLTKNPYHTGRTTGGSSGGEAALMAALATPISLCSDIGGSTRMPAFFCGLFGYNPTANITSLKGSLQRSGDEDTMASIGFVSRHVEDLAPLTKIVAAPRADLLKLDQSVDLKKIKYFYVETSKDLRLSSIQPDLRKAMRRVIIKLTEEAADTGNAPETYYHDGFNYMFVLWRYWMTKEKETFAEMLANKQGTVNGLVELVKKVFGQSDFTLAAILKLLDDQILPPVDKEWAEDLTKKLREDLLNKLGDDGVLIFPSAPIPAPYHYSFFLRPFNFAYWGIFNVLRIPSVQVPLGLNSDGIPLGVQVVSGPNNDAKCLAVAAHMEKLFGGYVPPCHVYIGQSWK